MKVPALTWAGAVGLLNLIAVAMADESFFNFMSILQSTTFTKIEKIVDSELNDMFRDICFVSEVSETDLQNKDETSFVEPKKFTFTNIEQKEGDGGEVASARGSTAKVQKKCKPLPHKPSKSEPKGCGNPVCVIIDKKPRRFQSLCTLKEFLQIENRLKQVNFVQKGDCYDIIDNEDEGGALEKEWSNNADECSACQDNELCSGSVVLIVDLGSYLNGVSSAPGGGIHKENSEKGQKQSGIPFEFCNICEAMKFMQSSENLNVKTQLVGVGFGTTKELFPLNGGCNCMWTEFFDHDMPCNSDMDQEKHIDHLKDLEASYTGAFRICSPEDIMMTSHEGGSEITQIRSEQNAKVEGFGSDGSEFSQLVEMTKLSVTCRNSDQTIKKLPPPFLYAEDLNSTCLDYKTRYCCKTQTMWRPVSVTTFSHRMPASIPFGAGLTTYEVNKATGIITFTILVYDDKSDTAKRIVIPIKSAEKSGEFRGESICRQTEVPVPFAGRFTVKELPNRSKEYTLTLTEIDNEGNKGRDKKTLSTITVYLHWDQMATAAVATIIKDEAGLVSTTQVVVTDSKMGEKPDDAYITEENDQGKNGPSPYIVDRLDLNENSPLSEAVRLWKEKTITHKAVLNDKLGGKKTLVIESTRMTLIEIKSSLGALNMEKINKRRLWETMNDVFKTYSITTLIESPPMANLFHECEWKDWISRDYPGKSVDGSEHELRELLRDTKYAKSGCLRMPHYIDAMTMDDQVPWYELKMDGKTYETFKLSPFHGYICKDANGPKDYCQDMKVRYCCPKQLRATWSDWATWGKCDKECGGGIMKRTRTCFVDPKMEDNDNYNPRCKGQQLDRYKVETMPCNLNPCPEDAVFTAWSSWTSCSISCGKGTKTKTRYCLPAEGGGKECPEKSLNMDLFQRIEMCTDRDCDTFGPTPWSVWSTCSATCDQGQATRIRKCENLRTLEIVSNDNCYVAANDPKSSKYFMQTKACMILMCPIDGMWGNWERWSPCSQSCINEPESGDEVDTRAKRTRVRYCSNPLPQYRGKPCKRDEDNEFDPREDTESQKKGCITPASNEKGPVTPWCPEPCIFTEWGAWSACSSTCIEPNLKVSGLTPSMLLNNVDYNVYAVKDMPTRQRMKIMLKPAKNGGKCGEAKKIEAFNCTMMLDIEQCTICKEHCLGDQNPKGITNILDMEKLEYPTDDPKCVGYCPVNCQQEEFKIISSPKEKIEDYKKNKLDEIKRGADLLVGESEACYTFSFHRAAVELGAFDVAKEFVKHVEGMKTGRWRNRFPWRIIEGSDFEEALEDAAGNFFSESKDYESLIFEELERSVIPPNIEGIFGGASCMNDGKNITSQKKLLRKKRQYTAKGTEKLRTIGCDFPLCELAPLIKGDIPSPPCQYEQWTAWGEWGKCTKKCGEDGMREMKRKCVSSCDENKEGKNCPASLMGGLTDTKKGACTPCPPERYGTWSTWTEWSYQDRPACYKGKTDREIESRRVMRCQTSGEQSVCRPTVTGNTKGKETQSRFEPLPDCKPGDEY